MISHVQVMFVVNVPNHISTVLQCFKHSIGCFLLTAEPMISLLRSSKSDEDLLHADSPMLSEQRASKNRASIHGTSSSMSMVHELSNRLSKIMFQDTEEDSVIDVNTEAFRQEQHNESDDTVLSPVIKITQCSPVARGKQYRASSEDLTASGIAATRTATNTTGTLPPKPVTPIVKRFIPKHRKARSLGSK